MRIPAQRKNIGKLTVLAILINSVQIVSALAMLFYAIFSRNFQIPESAEIILFAVASGLVVWGAIIDIRDALIARRVDDQRSMLEDAYGQLERLNRTLREQRHDFKNHLQVIYSLTEMGAYADIQEYVQRIYEDVQSVGALMRTSIPAVNALLSAKSADCHDHGVAFTADIQSAWEEMPVAGWELCRIIGNLIDNAMDALREAGTAHAAIRVTIAEAIPCFTLSVENNGPEIPESIAGRIFESGFTTKSEGHGNGLAIVQELTQAYGGSVSLVSAPDRTCFSCSFPRPTARNGCA